MITIPQEQLYRSLRATTLCASTDPGRPQLSGVCFEVDASQCVRLVATDGHTMAMVQPAGAKVSTDHGPVSTVLPLEHVKTACALLKPSRSAADTPVQVRITEDLVGITIGAGSEVVLQCDSDLQFPPWRQVVPASDGCAGDRIGVNPVYLERVGKICRAWAPSKDWHDKPIVMSTAESLAPVRFDAALPMRGDLMVIVMPMRV